MSKCDSIEIDENDVQLHRPRIATTLGIMTDLIAGYTIAINRSKTDENDSQKEKEDESKISMVLRMMTDFSEE
jgi:hypothetical protein